MAFVKAIDDAQHLLGPVAVVTCPLGEGFTSGTELRLDLFGGHCAPLHVKTLWEVVGFDCSADFCTVQKKVAVICVIYSRLKQERERLGLTQPALAELAGAAKRTVVDWEKGASSPTAVQLAALAAAGADALYIVTGARSQAAAEVDLLPSDERVLVDAYRRCNAEARRNLIQTAALLSAGMGMPSTAATPPKRATPKPKPEPNSIQVGNMTNRAAGGVQVGYAGGNVTSTSITKVKKPKG